MNWHTLLLCQKHTYIRNEKKPVSSISKAQLSIVKLSATLRKHNKQTEKKIQRSKKIADILGIMDNFGFTRIDVLHFTIFSFSSF